MTKRELIVALVASVVLGLAAFGCATNPERKPQCVERELSNAGMVGQSTDWGCTKWQ